MEEKIKKLAHTIVNYSLALKENEKVQIIYQSMECNDLVKELIKEIHQVGALVSLRLIDPVMDNFLLKYANDQDIDLLEQYRKFENDHFDAFIQLRYNINDYEGKQVSSYTLGKMNKQLTNVQSVRINERKWVLLNYPSLLDAYKAHMPIADFKEYALDVMTVDYRKMSDDIEPLKKLMEQTDKVRIVSCDTDITFSIKGMKAIPCTGDKNIPDGEIYCAPVKDSVNGTITYNTPSPYQGNIYHHVSLTFKDGKIVKATCDEDDDALNKIFDTDEGARYVGEFSFGFNPKILYPMGDILYDEKILGSIHFTPGKAYHDSYNGNDSGIHWDMVLIQREDFGGGEIYFDDKLIRKNGLFVLEELKPLNYELNNNKQ